jgi:hypothetical protein
MLLTKETKDSVEQKKMVREQEAVLTPVTVLVSGGLRPTFPNSVRWKLSEPRAYQDSGDVQPDKKRMRLSLPS